MTLFPTLLLLAIIAVALFIFNQPLRRYAAIRSAGQRFAFSELMAMRIRRTCRKDIVNSWIQLRQAGLSVEMSVLETHALSKGSVSATTRALILAKEKGIPYTFQQLAAMDLKGEDVVKHVRLMS